MNRRRLVIGMLAVIGVGTAIGWGLGVPRWLSPRGFGHHTVGSVLTEVGPRVESKLAPIAQRAGIAWPPARLSVLAFKQERQMQVWIANERGAHARLATYPILAASGGLGPKRKQGDRQVPEGFYRFVSLNPNSRFYLSLELDYPNADDIARSSVPLEELGGEIFVHGSNVSVGCLAIGDDAIEELFVVAARVPSTERRILIAPVDFRRRMLEPSDESVRELYRRLRFELSGFAVKS